MADVFEITVAAPDKQLYVGQVQQVNLPSTEGEIGVRVGHMPAVIGLKAGVVEVISEDGKEAEHFAITGGFAEVLAQRVSVLVLAGNPATELAEETILAAKERAQVAQAAAATREEFTEAAAALEKALAELKAVQRRRRWRQ